jgi:hypothetical protein
MVEGSVMPRFVITCGTKAQYGLTQFITEAPNERAARKACRDWLKVTMYAVAGYRIQTVEIR